METGTYAFISYSTQNQSHADAVRRIFTEQGIPNWMAPYDIPSGSKYAAELNKALKNCGCLVLLLSDASQNSEHVDKEVERAIAYKKPIVPIQIEELILNDSFEYYIGNCQIIAVPEIRMDNRELQRVLDGVRSFVGAAPAHQPVVLQESPEEWYQKGQAFYDEKNFTEAIKWFRKAAEQGHAAAQYNLGYCFDNSIGVDRDRAETDKWYRKAAEQGHAKAQYKLAGLYERDFDFSLGRDLIALEEARKWCHKAAENGNPDAASHLGWWYEFGLCRTPSNYIEALKWYRRAQELGKENLDDTIARLEAFIQQGELASNGKRNPFL